MANDLLVLKESSAWSDDASGPSPLFNARTLAATNVVTIFDLLL